MSTKAYIGIELESGIVEYIYCHWDGMQSGVGLILDNHYTDRAKVQELIDLGDISCLGPEVKPKEDWHSFYKREPGVTVAYIRDRGESVNGNAKKVARSRLSFLDKGDIPYRYLFTLENEWI